MNTQQQEEFDAQNARADRFDGFDRGDLDRDHEADQNDQNESDYAEMRAGLIQGIRNEIESLSALPVPRDPYNSHVAYLTHDFTPYQYNSTRGHYGLCAGEDVYNLSESEARRISNYFNGRDMPSSYAKFPAWRAARIDSLKSLADSLAK
jgi:hypothetical protein